VSRWTPGAQRFRTANHDLFPVVAVWLHRVGCLWPDVRNGPVSEYVSAQLDDRFQLLRVIHFQTTHDRFWSDAADGGRTMTYRFGLKLTPEFTGRERCPLFPLAQPNPATNPIRSGASNLPTFGQMGLLSSLFRPTGRVGFRGESGACRAKMATFLTAFLRSFI
jgi:hypothetical protein